jgi:uncharacterized protein (TIGR02145 family)/uncharacterized repeat protein (TIGR02543 family)
MKPGKLLCALTLTFAVTAAVVVLTCTRNPSDGGGAKYTLKTNSIPEDGGMVLLNPDQEKYTAGTKVLVTAVPKPDYTFSGWAGALTSTKDTATITVENNMTLAARFTPTATAGGEPQDTTGTGKPPVDTTGTNPTDTVTTEKPPVDTTATTPTDTGLFCRWEGAAGTCSPIGGASASAVASVTACSDLLGKVVPDCDAAKGGTFCDWGPPSEYGAGGCFWDDNADICLQFGIIVNFCPGADTTTYTLSIDVTGSGTVSRNPDNERYFSGTQVSVTANAASGYKFVGWSGASTSTYPTVKVTMNANMQLTANFQPVTYTLTTTISPNGGGIVTRSPDQASYAPGTQVTLMATAANGYAFAGWSGASSATNAVTVTMDGNKTVTVGFFRTVKIDGKTWMKENLNIQTSDSRCYDDDPANCAKYGRLYTWDAAMSACPVGWHLPTRAEWNTLVTAVGDYAGTKLKAKSPDWNGTDDYGFSALPGGSRGTDGSFYILGSHGYWWSATEYDAFHAYYRSTGSYSQMGASVRMYDEHEMKDYGFSVRCLQD